MMALVFKPEHLGIYCKQVFYQQSKKSYITRIYLMHLELAYILYIFVALL